MHAAAKFVMVETLRCVPNQSVAEDRPTTKSYLPGSSAEFAMEEQARWIELDKNAVDENEQPTTKTWVPGSSAERAYGWHRGQY